MYVSIMYLWNIINYIGDIPIGKDDKSATIKHIRELDEYKSLTEDQFKKYIQAGKRMIQHVRVFGWSILLWDDFNTATMLSRGDIEERLKNNNEYCRKICNRIDSQVSRDDAKLKIVKLINSMCGKEDIGVAIIEKIDKSPLMKNRN